MATVIQKAFKKTRASFDKPQLVIACINVCNAMLNWEKAVELEVMGRDAMNIRDIVVEKASAMDILKIRDREDDQSRALLIHSFAYNYM